CQVLFSMLFLAWNHSGIRKIHRIPTVRLKCLSENRRQESMAETGLIRNAHQVIDVSGNFMSAKASEKTGNGGLRASVINLDDAAIPHPAFRNRQRVAV